MRKIFVAMTIGLVLAAAPALAQTYPTGSTSTTVPATTTASVNLGTLGPKGSLKVDVCGFLANSKALGTVGNLTAAVQAGSNGCITISVTVIDPGSAALGRPVFAVAGLQLAAVRNSSLLINGHTVPGNPPGKATIITIRGIGSNGAQRTVTLSVTTSTSGSSGLPRTGAMILRWTALGLLLIVAGGVLVVARRESQFA